MSTPASTAPLAGVRKNLRRAYDALPEAGELTTTEVADRLVRDSLSVATSLKKLHTRGLVKREGRGRACHPYRWSRL